MNKAKFDAIVAELAAYLGVSTARVGEMTFLQASTIYWAMRRDLNSAK